jgi:hypothetical protein
MRCILYNTPRNTHSFKNLEKKSLNTQRWEVQVFTFGQFNTSRRISTSEIHTKSTLGSTTDFFREVHSLPCSVLKESSNIFLSHGKYKKRFREVQGYRPRKSRLFLRWDAYHTLFQNSEKGSLNAQQLEVQVFMFRQSRTSHHISTTKICTILVGDI